MLQQTPTQGRAVPAPPSRLTAIDGLTALRSLSGLIWTAEAMRLAEAISALPGDGAAPGEVVLPAPALDRMCNAMSPAPRGPRQAAEVLVGMAAVLALASGRVRAQGGVLPELAMVEQAGGVTLRAGRGAP